MTDLSTEAPAPEAQAHDQTPAATVETAPASSPNTTQVTAPVAADGTVKVEVTQKPEPTPEEREASDKAERRTKVTAAYDRAVARSKFERGEGPDPDAAKDRGPDGKFVAKPADGKAPVADAKLGHNKPPEETPLPAPASWSKEQKANWDKIPTETKQYLLEKDKEVARAFTATGQRYKQIESFAKNAEQFIAANKDVADTVTKYNDAFKSWGMRPHEAISNLMETAFRLQNDPKAEIKRLASESGLDLAAFAAEQIDPSLLPPDPRLSDAQLEINRLQRENQQLKQLRQTERGERETATAAQRQQEAQQVFGEVRNWFDAYETKQADFDAIAEDMADILPSMIRKYGRTEQAIEKAAEAARAANPQLRQAMINSQIAEAEKKRAAEAKRIMDAAKAANAVNVQGGVAGQGQMSVRQAQEAAWARAQRSSAA